MWTVSDSADPRMLMSRSPSGQGLPLISDAEFRTEGVRKGMVCLKCLLHAYPVLSPGMLPVTSQKKKKSSASCFYYLVRILRPIEVKQYSQGHTDASWIWAPEHYTTVTSTGRGGTRHKTKS